MLQQIINALYKRNIQSLIVEGGAQLLNSFLSVNLWDEARVITATKKLSELSKEKSGVEAPSITGQLIHSEKLESDFLKVFRNIFASSL